MPELVVIPENLLTLSDSFLESEAVKLIDKIQEDASEGKFQNNTSGYGYKEPYKTYKALGMRRITTDKTQIQNLRTGGGQNMRTLKQNVVVGRERKYKHEHTGKGQSFKTAKVLKAGSKLKGYEGVSVNTDVSKVNMRLTGRTLSGLHRVRLLKNGFELSYKPEDAGKVIGNEKRGYELVGVSNENIEMLKNDFIAEFNKNFDIGLKDINIIIGKN